MIVSRCYIILKLFYVLSPCYSYAQVTSNPVIDSLHSLIQSEEDDSMIVNFLSSISYSNRELDSDSAIYYGLQTLDLAAEISSAYGIEKVKRFIADTYEHAAMLPDARSNYEEAIEIFENLGKKDKVATTLLSLSILLTKEFKTEQAIEILHRLIDVSDETEDWDLGAYSRINLSGLYINQLNYEEALLQLQEADEIYGNLDLSDVALREYIDQQKPLLYINIGTAYHGLEELDSAAIYLI